MSADTRIATRSSTQLRTVVESYGQLSMATRALLIIAAAELGTPVAALKAEILQLDLGQLQDAVSMRLTKLLHNGATDGVHASPVGVPLPDALASDDEALFGLGFDV